MFARVSSGDSLTEPGADTEPEPHYIKNRYEFLHSEESRLLADQ